MTYIYDANGNIVSKTPYTNVTSSDLSTATQGAAIVYGYGDSNWSDKLTSYDGQTISYDASGNPTSYRGETVTWNGRLMTSFTKDDRRYEYSYNSDGMRTVKRVYEDNKLVYTYTYIWDGDVLLGGRMEVTDADEPISIRYLYDESGELYGMDYNGNGYFAFIKNLQGDIVSIVPLDPESNVEINMEYDAWGKPIIEQASSLAEGFMMAVLMAVTNVGYRGYFYDFETGLYYLRSRYYDPEIGRFINADDTAYLGYDSSPLSMNIFAYCENNPINGNDPAGSLSLNQLKKALEKALNAIKNWTNLIFNKIKAEAKRFLKIIKYSNGQLSISSTAASVVIDAVITACSKTSAAAMSAFGYSLNIAKKFAQKKLEDFFKKQMVPYITRGFINTFLTGARRIFWMFVSKSTNVALEYATAYTTDRIYGNYKAYQIVSLFSSWGSFICGMLDVCDGRSDGYITVRREKR